MKCPSCGRELPAGVPECPGCGIILAKWKAPAARTSPGRIPAPAAAAPRASQSSPLRLMTVLAIGLAGAALLIGGYWMVKIRPRVRAIEDPNYGSTPIAAKALKFHRGSGDFDVSVDLPGDPRGMVANGSQLLIGNRAAPLGFLRLRADGERFLSEKVPVIEPGYRQQVAFSAVSWNGSNYVGYTDGSWFQAASKNVFTIHDPVSLRVLEHRAAPELLGCLAWDGRGYWAATRRNTADSGEPAYLYRLDTNLKVVRKTEPPGVGCQGMAWDGTHLWFADVFADKLYVVDVAGATPRIVHAASLPFGYLSGVGFDGSNIWVTEYDNKRLHRLASARRMAWSGSPTPGGALVTTAATLAPVTALPETAESVDQLRRKLRGDNTSDQMHAEMELKKRGLPIDYDRHQDSFAKRPPDDCEVLDWSVEVRNGRLLGSWRLHFGDQLFQRSTSSASSIVSMPVFARYTVTVYPPGSQPVPHQFDASPGENMRQDVNLGLVSARGSYRVEMFLHVQYISPDGTNRILNRSGHSLEVEH